MKKRKLFKIKIEETVSEASDIYADNFEDAKVTAINKYNNETEWGEF